jgi:uncharacterized membrane protein
VSSYLTISHWRDDEIACGGLGDCNYVNSSAYARFGDVPVSLLGAGLYAGLIASAALWLLRPDDERRPVLFWGLSVAGFGYAAYLTYLELAVLDAICVWCVVSAVILTLALAGSTAAILLAPEEPAA